MKIIIMGLVLLATPAGAEVSFDCDRASQSRAIEYDALQIQIDELNRKITSLDEKIRDMSIPIETYRKYVAEKVDLMKLVIPLDKRKITLLQDEKACLSK